MRNRLEAETQALAALRTVTHGTKDAALRRIARQQREKVSQIRHRVHALTARLQVLEEDTL